MKLQDYKIIFIAIGLIGILLLSSPVIEMAVSLPAGEPFSEIYLLGPGHLAQNYPSSIVPGENYSVYLDVGNHVGTFVSYLVYVKMKNQTDVYPNVSNGAPSPVSPLYEFRFAIPDGATNENTVIFSVSQASITTNQSTINKITINNIELNINKPAQWDSNLTGYYYQLFFELWTYSTQSNSFQYDNRFVSLNLNLTQTLPIQ